MDKTKEKTLYIFIDESGDFNFSDNGSNYFILTAISTLYPLKTRDVIREVRYDLLKNGTDIECFHATNDLQKVRDAFYSKIKNLSDYEIDSVIAEKRKTNPTLYQEPNTKKRIDEKFYRHMCEALLRYIVRRYIEIKLYSKVKKVVVILDQVLVKRKRAYVTKSIKTYFRDNFGIIPYIYFIPQNPILIAKFLIIVVGR